MSLNFSTRWMHTVERTKEVSYCQNRFCYGFRQLPEEKSKVAHRESSFAEVSPFRENTEMPLCMARDVKGKWREVRSF